MNRRVFLASSLGLAAAACTGKNDNGGPSSSSAEPTSPPDEPVGTKPPGATDPSTTTTTSTSPPSTTGTTDPPVPTDPTVAPTDPPAATVAPTTGPEPIPTGPTDSGVPNLDGGFVASPAPSVPTTHTMPIPPEAVLNGDFLGGTLPDGVYWGSMDGLQEDPVAGVILRLVQVFFGTECEAAAAKYGGECLNDLFVLEKPSGLYTATVAELELITVAQSDPQKSLSVSYQELFKLVTGAPVDVPAGYQYTDFGFQMTIEGGVATRLEQVWTP